MARQPRIDLAGVPQHVIQRGNNRQLCFFDGKDRRLYLRWLREAAEKYGVSVHAYVLMDNHAHLLATGAANRAIGRMMQGLGRRYVRYINSRYERTGTLWEGRYKSNPIASDRYMLTCYRYVELNPVRASMVTHPGDYRWSSYDCNANGRKDELISPHETYLALGQSPVARFSAYQRLFRNTIGEDDLNAIREHVRSGTLLGSE